MGADKVRYGKCGSGVLPLGCATGRPCNNRRLEHVHHHSRPQARRFLVTTGRLQIKPSGSGDENGKPRKHCRFFQMKILVVHVF